MNKKQKNIALVICLVVLAFLIFLKIEKAYSPENTNSANKEIPASQVTQTVLSTIIVDKEILHLTSIQGESLYSILLKEKENNNFSFSGKEYPGMGFFTTDIGILHSTKDHYLMYYINGKEAEVGISSYVPKNGDIIEWKLK